MKEAVSRNRRQVGEVWKASGRDMMREDLRSYCGRGEDEEDGREKQRTGF